MYEIVYLTWASSSCPGLIETTQWLSQESAPSCNMYTVTKDLLFSATHRNFAVLRMENCSDAIGPFCPTPRVFFYILTGWRNLPVSGARPSPLLEKKHHLHVPPDHQNFRQWQGKIHLQGGGILRRDFLQCRADQPYRAVRQRGRRGTQKKGLR